MNINRHLQAILQCHLFPKIATLDSTSEARKDFARLLHVIFHTHPANTCQASHVQPIIQLYAGTLSSADQRLLSIFRLFEKQRKVSIASLVAFRPQQNAMDPRTALDALLELDSARVFRAVMSFPAWIKLDFHGTGNSLEGSDNASVYDPVFVMLLCAQVLQTSLPSSALSWVSFFRTNIISLTFRCLSCKDEDLRKLALSILGSLYDLLQVRNSFH